MTEYYFAKFPVISYNSTNTRNISERTRIIHTQAVDPDNYYTITLPQDDTRADNLAYSLYGDPFLDWELWLNNNMVDPYYNWHLNQKEFKDYINDTYGSVAFAQQKIVYWRTSWPTETNRITVSDFDFNIPGLWKKYYQPFFNSDGTVLYYQPGFYDWRSQTNEIVTYSLSNAVSFAPGNVVQTYIGPDIVGQAQVADANTTLITLQHTQNSVNSSITSIADMFNANVVANVTNFNLMSQNINLDEIVFWEPLTYYDMEDERNTIKKYISVLDPGIALNVSTLITNELQS